MALEVERGGVSLPIPEQEVVENGGTFRLEYRTTVPVESWNEQVSLLTGMAAADLMLHGEVGVLRTLPKAPDGALDRLRRAARALGVAWPADQSYAEVVHGLDPANPPARCAARGGHRPCSAARATRRSTGACRSRRPTRRWLRRTRTSPHRCAGWSTGTSARVCLALCAGEDVPGWVLSAPAATAGGDGRGRPAGP